MSATPGPWHVCGGYTPTYTAIMSADGYIVFGMADHADDEEGEKPIKAPSYETQRDNARLIAAAPDLLAACEAMVDWCRRNKMDGPAMKQSLAAILKAKGGD